MKRTAIAALLAFLPLPALAAGGYGMLNAGIDLLNQGLDKDAIPWFDKALAAPDLVPDQIAVAHLDRGIAYNQTREPQKAIADFTAALELRPGDFTILANRSFAYVATHQGENALADITTLQNQKPNSIALWFQRGLVDWQLDRFDDASAAFAKTVDAGQPFGWLWQQLASLKVGKPALPATSLHYASLSQKLWPRPLIALYSGDQDESHVFSVLETGASSTMTCEANFYIAEWKILHNDKGGAKVLMQKAAEDCPPEDVELRMAKFELEKLH